MTSCHLFRLRTLTRVPSFPFDLDGICPIFGDSNHCSITSSGQEMNDKLLPGPNSSTCTAAYEDMSRMTCFRNEYLFVECLGPYGLAKKFKFDLKGSRTAANRLRGCIRLSRSAFAITANTTTPSKMNTTDHTLCSDVF